MTKTGKNKKRRICLFKERKTARREIVKQTLITRQGGRIQPNSGDNGRLAVNGKDLHSML